jgi:AcrR family transcriptional regulator
MEPFSERQEQIINASIELISEQSIQALTIKNIAKKINVTDGAIYRHFPSKTSILLGIILPFQQQAEKTLKEACSLKIPAIAQLNTEKPIKVAPALPTKTGEFSAVNTPKSNVLV